MIATSAPNPFERSTVLSYRLPASSPLKLEVLDVMGRLVQTLVNETKTPGAYQATWDGTGAAGEPAPSGTYFYRVQSESTSEAWKVVLRRWYLHVLNESVPCARQIAVAARIPPLYNRGGPLLSTCRPHRESG